MQQKKIFISVCLSGILYFLNSCNTGSSTDNNSFSSDAAVIAVGKSLFENCSACHSFKQDGIGPGLGRITNEVPVEWLQRFIRNPQEMILSGDGRVAELRKKFKSPMPSFAAFKDDDLNAILAFLHANKVSTPYQKMMIKEFGTLFLKK